ncbi:Transcription factor MYB23, partial [Cucurbita argyrosperma subsp. argyrosperma]
MDAEEKEWRKGPWTPEEDKLLSEYVKVHGEGRWTSVATDIKTSPPISFEQDREEKDMMKPCERDNDELGMVFTEPAAMAADQSYLSMVYEDFATWAAAAAAEESYLWGGLWEDSNNLL